MRQCNTPVRVCVCGDGRVDGGGWCEVGGIRAPLLCPRSLLITTVCVHYNIRLFHAHPPNIFALPRDLCSIRILH